MRYREPTEVLRDPYTSHWLKVALSFALERECILEAHLDARELVGILDEEANRQLDAKIPF